MMLQQFIKLQDIVAQSHMKLQANKSPRDSYDEKVADVRTRIAEVWEVYPHRSPHIQSELQEAVVNSGRQLEKLDIEFTAGFEDAYASYRHRLEDIWGSCCRELLAIPLVSETLRKILSEEVKQNHLIGASRDIQKGSQSAATVPSGLQSGSTSEDCDGTSDINGEISHVRSMYLTKMSSQLTNQEKTKI